MAVEAADSIESLIPEAYLGSATQLKRGMELLVDQPVGANVFALSGGFAVECALKAYLSCAFDCKSDADLKKHGVFRHDLECLWDRAVDAGLQILREPPECVRDVNARHSTFVIRYPLYVNGLTLPSYRIVERIDELITKVTDGISQSRAKRAGP